ncbi:Crp/Fnr family transcriptional regulator [Actinoplanes sp. GCM10030250]|uniref:Crp/Fnr family transcriptional regulator n=1 Tax=Actinoplanes sp. GCM10030250 TaxID=3273376 RepID=UPI00360F1113
MHEREPAVSRSNLRTPLSDNAKKLLDSLGRPLSYRAGKVLFHQADPSTHVAFLIAGWVKVVSGAPSGEEAIIAIRGPGDVLGELSAIDGSPRSATVVALVDVDARVVPGEEFVNAVCGSPELSRALLRHLAVNLRQSDRKRLEYLSTDTFQRLIALLVEMIGSYGHSAADGAVEIRLPLSQQDMATAAAMSRPAVARGLRKLRERGLVETGGRYLVITRPELLRAIHERAGG